MTLLTSIPLNLDLGTPRPEIRDARLARIAAKTVEMIEKYGRPVALIRKAKGTPADATKSWRGDAGPEIRTNTLALEDDFTQEEVDGKTILSGDKKLHVAAESLTEEQTLAIKDNNLVVDGEDTWRIVGQDPIEVGVTPLLFTLHVRKRGR